MRCDDLGEIFGQAAQLGPDRRVQGTRVHALGNRRFVPPTRQTWSRALLWSPIPFRYLPALSITSTLQLGLRALRTAPTLPIVVALWIPTALLPASLIGALDWRLPRATCPWPHDSMTP